MILVDRRNAIVESMFVPCEQPILETPAPQRQQSKATARTKAGKTMGAMRRSSQQKAKICSVPVSRRASHRLIKAFEITGPNKHIGEEALETFAKTFNRLLTPSQIEAVRKLTSLDSGPVMAAMTQLVAAEGAEAMGDTAV
jgi:hypothetical protein